MRILLALIGAVTVLSFSAFSTPARASGGALTGKMAMFDYLLAGSWTCSTKVPAMEGHPAHTDQSTLRFDVAPDNVLHDHVSAADYASDDYYAFDPKSNMYWNGTLGSTGTHGYASSSDGNSYSGLSWAGKSPAKVTTTYTKVNANMVKAHVVTTVGLHEVTIDSVCTR